MAFILQQEIKKSYKDLKPNSKDASVTEWYKDSPKLLRANNLTLFVSSSIISIVIVMPLNTEFTQLSFFNSLKLNGHPFFNTSFEFSPSNSIIALEWDKSVIAKSVCLNDV